MKNRFGAFTLNFFGIEESYSFVRRILHILVYLLLAIYIFSIPAFSYRTGYYLISWGLAIGLFVSIIVYCVLYTKILFDRNIIILVIFNIAVLFSTFLNGFRDFSTQIPLSSLMCFLLFQFFKDTKNKDDPLKFIYIGFILFALVFFVVDFKNIIAFSSKRLGSEFGNQNSIGAVFSLLSTIGFYYFFKSPKHFYHIIIALTSFYFTLLTGSRGGLLVIAVALLFIIIFKFGKKRWYISLIILLLSAVVAIVVLSLDQFQSYRERILSIFTLDSSDEALAGRSIRIYEAFELFFEKPLFGWGINGFANNTIWRAYAHNTLSETIANFGFVGMLLFFIMFFTPFPRLIQQIRDNREDCVGFIILLAIVISFVSTVFYSQKEKFVLLALVFSIHFRGCQKIGKIDNQNTGFFIFDITNCVFYVNLLPLQSFFLKHIPFLYKTL